MDQVSEISSVIQDHVEGLAAFEVQGLLNAPHVLLVGLALPCIHYTNGVKQKRGQLGRFSLVGDQSSVGGAIILRRPCDVEPQWRTPPMLFATL